VIVSGEAHLRRCLKSYTADYNQVRTHIDLRKNTPKSRQVHQVGSIIALPVSADYITTTS